MKFPDCQVVPTGTVNAKGYPGYLCPRCKKVRFTAASVFHWQCATEAERAELARRALWRPGAILRRAFKWGTILRWTLLFATCGAVKLWEQAAGEEGCKKCRGREGELNRLGAFVHWWLFVG